MTVQKNLGFKQTTHAITGTASQVLDVNAGRNYLIVQNRGDGNVYLNFSGEATTSNGILLKTEEAYEAYTAPTNSLSIISDTTSSVVVVEA